MKMAVIWCKTGHITFNNDQRNQICHNETNQMSLIGSDFQLKSKYDTIIFNAQANVNLIVNA